MSERWLPLPVRWAARCGSSNKCEYLAVVFGFECPSKAPISARLCPLLMSWLAKECLRSWMRSPVMPALAHSESHGL